MIVPERKHAAAQLHPVTAVALLLLNHVLCSSRTMWLVGLEQGKQQDIMEDLFTEGIIAKVVVFLKQFSPLSP
jgi:hypothetical protein